LGSSFIQLWAGELPGGVRYPIRAKARKASLRPYFEQLVLEAQLQSWVYLLGSRLNLTKAGSHKLVGQRERKGGSIRGENTTVVAWQGMARHSKAWQGMARHGKARQGRARVDNKRTLGETSFNVREGSI